MYNERSKVIYTMKTEIKDNTYICQFKIGSEYYVSTMRQRVHGTQILP